MWRRSRVELVAVGTGIVCTVIGATVLWKDKLTGNRYNKPADKDARKKVFLVTGANSGIGKATALELASREHKVYMLCRNMESCEEARSSIVLGTGNKFVYCRPCDLASHQSVRECAENLPEDTIDGLINNAGVMCAPRSYSKDGIETHWAVNHLGHYLLTRLLYDRLAKGEGRVAYLMNLDYRKAAPEGVRFDDINLEKNYDKNVAFYQSQLANVLVLQQLAERWKSDGVSVSGVYPGVVNNTNIKRHMGVHKSMLSQYILKPVLWFVERTPADGAQTVLYLMLEDHPMMRTGKLYAKCEEMAFFNIAKDKGAAKRLIDIDDYWTGLKTKEQLQAELKQKLGRASQ